MQDVKVTFDSEGVKERLEKCQAKAQKILDARVLQDSNFYCPKVSGTLQRSGILSTVIGSGSVVWDMDYAQAQYYGLPNKTTSQNPNARCKWFEAAKTKNLKLWVEIVNGEYN